MVALVVELRGMRDITIISNKLNKTVSVFSNIECCTVFPKNLLSDYSASV